MTSRVMQDFDLLMPQSISEVTDLLNTHKNNSAIMAGGTDLLISLKFDYAVDNVISLALVPDLNILSFDLEEGLTIGAKVTIADVLKSNDVKEHYPALWQVAKVFATPQLRNTATVVGNLLRASPAGDCSLALYALGGRIILESMSGRREVDLDDFWLSYGVTACQDNELAIAVKITPPLQGQKSAFRRMTRTHEDLSKIGAAVCLKMDGDICQAARVAMGCVGPTLIRLPGIEQMLEGRDITNDVLQQVADHVSEEITPIDDKRSSADYRRQVAGVLVRRVIEQAMGQDSSEKGNDQ